MTSAARAGLLVGALAVAAIAFLALRPGDDESDPPATAPAQSTGASSKSEPESPATPPTPEVTRLRIRGGEAVGGVRDIEVEKDDRVRIVIAADADDELHLHGYDVSREAAPGRPARFILRTNLEGVFEIESHTAEDAGKRPLVARLVVGPS